MTGTTSLRAGLYARQSIDVAEGITRQIERGTALVSARGWTLTEVFKDNDVSASKARGEGTDWHRMLTWAREHRIDVVVATNLDRLLRTQRDLLALMDTGVLVTTLEGEIDLASASGELQASVLTSMARFEARRKSERQQRANAHKVGQGRPLWSRTVFGWDRAGRIIPEQADAIRAAFQQVLDGPANLSEIARRWNSEGFVNADGKPWSSLRVRATLLRPEVAGIATYRRKEQPGVRSTVEAIVDEATYLSARAILTDPARGAGGHPRSHELSGVFECAKCHRRLRAFWRKKARGVRLTWRCPSMCTTILDETIRPLIADEIMPLAFQEGIRQPRPTAGLGDEARAALRARKEALVIRLDQAADAVVRDALTVGQAEKITVAARAEIAEIDAKLAEPVEKPARHLRTMGEIEAVLWTRDYLSQYRIQVHTMDAPKRVTIERREQSRA